MTDLCKSLLCAHYRRDAIYLGPRKKGEKTKILKHHKTLYYSQAFTKKKKNNTTKLRGK